MNRLKRVLTLFLGLLLTGCVPEERMWWSPKGDRALVLIDGQLHLVGSDGEMRSKLSGLDTKDIAIKTVDWLDDGERFVCVRQRVLHSWAEVMKSLPAEEAEQVDALMPAALPLFEAAVKLSPTSQKLEQLMSSMPAAMRMTLYTALMRLFETNAAKVEAVLAPLPDLKPVLDSTRESGPRFEMDELCLITLKEDQIADTTVLSTSLLKRHALPKISPTGDLVAFVRFGEYDDHAALDVIQLADRSLLTITSPATPAFQWTPDGRALVFMSPVDGESSTLNAIKRRTVLNGDGKLLTDAGDHFKVLATVVTYGSPALTVLQDGRILFAAQPVALPFTGGEPKEEPRLFLLSSDGDQLTTVPTAPGALPTDLGHFTLSPDGKRIALVEGGSDAVALVDIESGSTRIISPPHDGWKCRTLPAWRSADEVIFAGVHNGKPSLLRWKDDLPVERFGSEWVDAPKAAWLEAPKKETP